jgi:hypothetical protein
MMWIIYNIVVWKNCTVFYGKVSTIFFKEEEEFLLILLRSSVEKWSRRRKIHYISFILELNASFCPPHDGGSEGGVGWSDGIVGANGGVL